VDEMQGMFGQFTSVTGVHLALGDDATRGVCAGCGRTDALTYPWPMAGALGNRCAVCVVKESGGLDAA